MNFNDFFLGNLVFWICYTIDIAGLEVIGTSGIGVVAYLMFVLCILLENKKNASVGVKQ